MIKKRNETSQNIKCKKLDDFAFFFTDKTTKNLMFWTKKWKYKHSTLRVQKSGASGQKKQRKILSKCFITNIFSCSLITKNIKYKTLNILRCFFLPIGSFFWTLKVKYWYFQNMRGSNDVINAAAYYSIIYNIYF